MEQQSNDDNEKKKRPRIKTENLIPLEVDPDAFIRNKASDKAKKILDNRLTFIFEIWFDKHLHNRQQYGDKDGPRIGIDNETILPLLKQALQHIIFYSLNVHTFSALDLDKRVCIRNNPNDGTEALNLVIQIHSKNTITDNLYEITVITAMSVDDFKIRDGQYVIELLDNETSILKWFTRGGFKEICNI